VKTINGKKIEEVFRELARDFPKEDVKLHDVTQKPYVPVEKIRNRLDEVVGIWNWSFKVSEPQLWKNGTVESCVVSGTMIIYDDERGEIEKGAAGGATIIYPSESERPTSVANAVDSATKDVLKRCAKLYNIADNLERYASNQPISSDVKKSKEVMRVDILGIFTALPKGGAKAIVSYNNEKKELIIFEKEWNHLTKKYPDNFQIGKRLNELNLIGSPMTYRGQPQIRFFSLAKAHE